MKDFIGAVYNTGMKKILLVLEDYAERAFLTTLLKKVGWDVETAKSELGINTVILNFAPEVILINAFGEKIKGEFLLKRLGGLKNKPYILLVTKNRKLSDDQVNQLGYDGAFSSPIDIKNLFTRLEDLGGIKATNAFSKLSQQKLSSEKSKQQEQNENKMIRSRDQVDLNDSEPESGKKYYSKEEYEAPKNPQEAVERAKEKLGKFRFSDPARAQRNAEYVKSNPTGESEFDGIPKDVVSEQVEDFRRLSDDPDVEQIDRERKEFVVAMFELGKKD